MPTFHVMNAIAEQMPMTIYRAKMDETSSGNEWVFYPEDQESQTEDNIITIVPKDKYVITTDRGLIDHMVNRYP